MPAVEKVIQCMLAMQRHPWEQGVCAQALYEAGREEYWIPMAYDAIRRQAADGRLAMVGGGAAVSDPASNGEVCLRAWQRTGDPFFLQGAQRMLDYLEHAAPRGAEGIICHNNVSFEKGYSAAQLWIDGLYMVPPFLAAMGRMEEAAGQTGDTSGISSTGNPACFSISWTWRAGDMSGRSTGPPATAGR